MNRTLNLVHSLDSTVFRGQILNVQGRKVANVAACVVILQGVTTISKYHNFNLSEMCFLKISRQNIKLIFADFRFSLFMAIPFVGYSLLHGSLRNVRDPLLHSYKLEHCLKFGDENERTCS